jgi:hypothetical protein
MMLRPFIPAIMNQMGILPVRRPPYHSLTAFVKALVVGADINIIPQVMGMARLGMGMGVVQHDMVMLMSRLMPMVICLMGGMLCNSHYLRMRPRLSAMVCKLMDIGGN